MGERRSLEKEKDLAICDVISQCYDDHSYLNQLLEDFHKNQSTVLSCPTSVLTLSLILGCPEVYHAKLGHQISIAIQDLHKDSDSSNRLSSMILHSVDSLLTVHRSSVPSPVITQLSKWRQLPSMMMQNFWLNFIKTTIIQERAYELPFWPDLVDLLITGKLEDFVSLHKLSLSLVESVSSLQQSTKLLRRAAVVMQLTKELNKVVQSIINDTYFTAIAAVLLQSARGEAKALISEEDSRKKDPSPSDVSPTPSTPIRVGPARKYYSTLARHRQSSQKAEGDGSEESETESTHKVEVISDGWIPNEEQIPSDSASSKFLNIISRSNLYNSPAATLLYHTRDMQ